MVNSTMMTGTFYTDAQRRGVQDQLDLLLQNSHFSNSRRFPSFLRFIIQEELEGRGDLLKERTLGVQVFGRTAGYDTTSDPIVRVTAAEIRKRIAQYYQEDGHEAEIRISLPPGSYVPHFEWRAAAEISGEIVPLGIELEKGILPVPVAAPTETMGPLYDIPAPSLTSQPRGKKISRTMLSRLLLAILLVVITAGAWFVHWSRPSAMDQFWAPVLHAEDAVVICFPRQQVETLTLRNAANPEERQRFQEPSEAVNVDDLDSLVSLTGLLQSRHQRFTLLGPDVATLTDLRHGPAILLGAFDNAWALRVTRDLRYRFANDEGMKHFWIEDTQGARTRWQLDRSQQVSTNNYRDYAIVARLMNPSTGQFAVISAGIARGGTEAAGEFLTQPANMEAIREHAPAGWDQKNMEFVLSTEIINGRSAPPKIEAMYFW